MMTRERLLDAAADLFREVGFRDVTIFQIMDRAQANRATFYLHFRDKLDLAAAVARRIGSSDNTALFEELAGYENPTVDDIRKWIERRLTITGKDPVLVSIIFEVIASEPNFAREYGAYLEYLADVVMKNAYAHLDSKRQKIVRSKIIMLTMLLDRVAMQIQHQKLEFAQKLSLDSMAEMLWTAVFGEKGRVAAPSGKSRTVRRQKRVD